MSRPGVTTALQLDQLRDKLMKKVQRTLRADGEATHNRILEAAGELFAEAGFAETTNKAIASRASADLALINYHFGSRGGLYEAVLIEAHRRLMSVESLHHVAISGLSPRDKLRQIIETVVDSTTADRGWHTQVLAREILSPSSHLQVLMESTISTKAPIALGVLSEITAIPVDEPSLLRSLISVFAPCALLLVIGRNISPFASEVRRMPREDLVEHLYTFAVGGLDAIRQKHEQR